MSDHPGKYHYVLPEIVAQLASDKPFGAATMQATRYSYADAILELGERNPNVVVLDADVSKSMRTNDFAKRFPERSFNFGIAEQNMMAAAAGIATTGLIPFASTYAVFASMRALDQVRNSIHYTRLNVKIAASHSGITPGPDGVTHQAQEDLSLLRAIANSTVIAPADPVSAKLAVFAAAAYDGPVYLSFTRDPVPTLYSPDFPLEIGRAVVVRDGADATIIALARSGGARARRGGTAGRRWAGRASNRLPHAQAAGRRMRVARGARDGRHRHCREQRHLRRPGQRGRRGAGGESPDPDAADRRA